MLTDIYPSRYMKNTRGSYLGYYFRFWSCRGNPFKLTSEHRGVCHSCGRKISKADEYQNAVNQFMDKTKNVWGICRTIFKEELLDWYLKCAQIENIVE